MASTGSRRAKKIKVILIAFIVLVPVGIGALFIGYRRLAQDPQHLLSVLGENVNMSLGRIQHTATRDGVKEWTLEAQSARLVESKKQMVLTGLSIVYYTPENGEIYITAEKGTLDTQSNDIEVEGNVVLINEPYELQTEKLNYDHEKQMIHADEKIRIISTTSYLGARSMSFDIKKKTVRFTGSVEGIFAENFNIR